MTIFAERFGQLLKSNIKMDSERTYYRTVVISDVHLGAPHSKLKEVTRFLNSVDCDTLILAGDIIDGWQLKKHNNPWTPMETAFFYSIIRLMNLGHAKTVYVTGNHDDFLDGIVPSELFTVSLVSEYVLESGDNRFVVIHGHAFDAITTHMRWLAKLGDVGYNFLLKFNKLWNLSRERHGVGHYSFSQIVKQKVKQVVNIVSGFEGNLYDFAKSKKCNGIICGHIHHPCDKMLKGEIRYLNCGDWVESLTALVETMEGEWKIVRYTAPLPLNEVHK